MPVAQKIPLRLQLQAVAKNKPYLLALLGQVLFGFILYGRNADLLYYFTYVENDAVLFTYYSMAIIIPSDHWSSLLSEGISIDFQQGLGSLCVCLWYGYHHNCTILFQSCDLPHTFLFICGTFPNSSSPELSLVLKRLMMNTPGDLRLVRKRSSELLNSFTES